MYNIIQVEFFRVKYKGVSLDEYLGKVGDRISEALELNLPPDAPGVGIKTVVRFLDRDRSFTKAVLETEWIKKRIDRYMHKLTRSRWELRRFWLGHKADLLSKRRSDAISLLRVRAARELRQALTHGHPVAIEIMDHSFRLIRPEEAHEVVEIAARASACWIFVFKPGDLCFDQGTIVTSAK